MTETQALTRQTNAITREEFGGSQVQNVAETAALAVAARERAKIEAMYLMAERHPRNWDLVRVRLLSHCDRPGFAEIARYKKPQGNKQVNGQWVKNFVEGLSARFGEIARQEMGNTSTEAAVVYEDDLIRIVRASVIDLERNNNDAREVTIAKVVERRGKRNGRGEWDPPEGRDVISQRINSYGEPVFLVKATDDEIRSKQNSEISKSQRDESLRLIPKDIRDDCEARVLATLADPKKIDPTAARKKMLDGFASIGVMPDDLVTYIGTSLDRMSPPQLDELRGLYTAIRDGETTFNEAMRLRFDGNAEGEAETAAQRDIRLQRQRDEEDRQTREKLAKEKQSQSAATPAANESDRADEPQFTEEQLAIIKVQDRLEESTGSRPSEAAARQIYEIEKRGAAEQSTQQPGPKPQFGFGGRKPK